MSEQSQKILDIFYKRRHKPYEQLITLSNIYILGMIRHYLETCPDNHFEYEDSRFTVIKPENDENFEQVYNFYFEYKRKFGENIPIVSELAQDGIICHFEKNSREGKYFSFYIKNKD